MIFIQADFFTYKFDRTFKVITTDPPYKGCLTNQLQEQNFDSDWFMQRCDEITEDVAVLVSFTNFMMIQDLRDSAKKTNWEFKTYMVWDKAPTRTWYSWSRPLRTCEFILYFTKGGFPLDFRTGEIKPGVKRSSFGGQLKTQSGLNIREVSYGMYGEVVRFRSPRKRVHPTQKPEEFSTMFKQILKTEEILDPFCGSGALLKDFPQGVGMDIVDWTKRAELKKAKSQTLIQTKLSMGELK